MDIDRLIADINKQNRKIELYNIIRNYAINKAHESDTMLDAEIWYEIITLITDNMKAQDIEHYIFTMML